VFCTVAMMSVAQAGGDGDVPAGGDELRAVRVAQEVERHRLIDTGALHGVRANVRLAVR
jgi:hypothetical protein